MKRTRHRYHYAVCCCKRNVPELQKLAETVTNSSRFWSELKKINLSHRISTFKIDNAVGKEEIVEKYKYLYNSIPTTKSKLCEINSTIKQIDVDVAIMPHIIETCTKRLKRGKDDGNHGFKSDHIINGSKKLFLYLSLLFRTMIVHGYNPSDLLLSTIISIPKDLKGSLSKSDNYRGISLVNSICKLFDYVIINLYDKQLKTSDMQFGFKSNHSTTMCSAIYMEIINKMKGSDVYSCMLDASKAFDRVHFGSLFRLLLKHNLPLGIVKLLLDSYTSQQACTVWDQQKSSGRCYLS